MASVMNQLLLGNRFVVEVKLPKFLVAIADAFQLFTSKTHSSKVLSRLDRAYCKLSNDSA